MNDEYVKLEEENIRQVERDEEELFLFEETFVEQLEEEVEEVEEEEIEEEEYEEEDEIEEEEDLSDLIDCTKIEEEVDESQPYKTYEEIVAECHIESEDDEDAVKELKEECRKDPYSPNVTAMFTAYKYMKLRPGLPAPTREVIKERQREQKRRQEEAELKRLKEIAAAAAAADDELFKKPKGRPPKRKPSPAQPRPEDAEPIILKGGEGEQGEDTVTPTLYCQCKKRRTISMQTVETDEFPPLLLPKKKPRKKKQTDIRRFFRPLENID